MLFALTLPGLVCLLVLLAALEGFGHWTRSRSWLPWRRRWRTGAAPPTMSGIAIQELDAFMSAGRRLELEEHKSMSMMRHDDETGAPPRIQVDLDKGTATFRQ